MAQYRCLGGEPEGSDLRVAEGCWPVIFSPASGPPIVRKMPLWKSVAFAAGLGLSMLSSVRAPPATGGDTVQGPCDSLLSRMQNGRTLGQSGRFHATGTGYLLRL